MQTMANDSSTQQLYAVELLLGYASKFTLKILRVLKPSGLYFTKLMPDTHSWFMFTAASARAAVGNRGEEG